MDDSSNANAEVQEKGAEGKRSGESKRKNGGRTHHVRKAVRIAILVIGAALAVIVITGLVMLVRWVVLSNQASSENAAILELVEAQMPSTASLPTWDPDSGPLTAVDVNGESFVGVLEIPWSNSKLPVKAAWVDGDLSPGVYSGTPSHNDLVIGGPNLNGVFGGIETIPDKQAISFTDMENRTYNFFVVAAETLPASELDTVDDDPSDWDLTLFCSSPSGTQIEILRLASTF